MKKIITAYMFLLAAVSLTAYGNDTIKETEQKNNVSGSRGRTLT